ncbi:MAG: DegT/DnrJ/EryC1/StrS family aminotransferase, partial [Pseudomonadales bacterium]|nr:DegT/DnrJ/EryC1/StrS family aminotransferase [Pseudomonadales bacterium]
IARFAELAASFHLTLIEDAAEALGVAVARRPAGCFGALGCFSFNGNKTITTGSGGMVVTKPAELAERVRFLSQQAKLPGGEYVHPEIGFNYRMTNLHAALGLAQLERLDDHLRHKREIAARYRSAFEGAPGLSWMTPLADSESAWWLFTIALDPDVTGVSSRQLMAHLDAAGIESRPLWQPLHLSPAHAGRLRLNGEVADRIYQMALSLPSSVGLSPGDQSRVIAEVHKALKRR